jgi:xanthine dehydrogenase accessory factor
MGIYNEIAENLARGKSFVLATLIRTAGSVPRDVGAKMLVFGDSTIHSTIGGGKFELQVIEDSLGLIKSGAPNLLKAYRLEESGPDALGMFCGGEADVFMELIACPEKLVIFGGGHVGRDLAKIALGLNFHIVVVDDRPEILSGYSLPVETILTDSQYQQNYPELGKDSYVVIVTHGHRCDREVLEKVIGQGCAYIGMIGSKNKVAKTFALLREAGISQELLAKVHAPIGLDIGGEGPYEIAVAIAAEIVASKRGKNKREL